MAMNYCPDCGLKLPASIDDVGTPARFCPRCGYSLTGEKPASVRPDSSNPRYVRNTAAPLTASGVVLGTLLGSHAHHSYDGADLSTAQPLDGFGDFGDFGGIGDFGGFGDF